MFNAHNAQALLSTVIPGSALAVVGRPSTAGNHGNQYDWVHKVHKTSCVTLFFFQGLGGDSKNQDKNYLYADSCRVLVTPCLLLPCHPGCRLKPHFPCNIIGLFLKSLFLKIVASIHWKLRSNDVKFWNSFSMFFPLTPVFRPCLGRLKISLLKLPTIPGSGTFPVRWPSFTGCAAESLSLFAVLQHAQHVSHC